MIRITEKSKIEDISSETLLVGSFYANPNLFLDYENLIVSKYDFNQPTNKFLYDSICELYNIHGGSEINETKINIYMNENPDRKKKYEYLKGYKYIERITQVIDQNEFDLYYKKLKKYSLLREFERKGFPVQKIMDNKNFEKLDSEQIIKAMEYQINTIGTVIGGVQDSVILGGKIKDRINQWKIKPDVGLELPFFILNQLIRGLRKKKFNLIGMHSGFGKSRVTSLLACYIGIKLGIPIFVGVNEQDEEEWDAMVLSAVINNEIFGFRQELRKLGLDGINETNIVTNALNEKEEMIRDMAADYIEKNSKIHFLELSNFDELTLKRQLKRHKLKGCELFIYDTMKSADHDWMSFVKTADMLKESSKEMDISVWATFQLTDDSLFAEILTSQAIANGKHIKHVADSLMMAQPIFKDQYENFSIYNPNDEFMGETTQPLDITKKYYKITLDKNRGGTDKINLCLEVDKGNNTWVERGYLIPSQDKTEFNQLKKEQKKLKQLNEVKKLRESLGKD